MAPKAPSPTRLDLPLGPLRLEKARGYTDRAVEGGLGPFMERWAAAVSRSVVSEPSRQAALSIGALFAGYARASVAERQRLVEAAEEAVRALARQVSRRARAPRPEQSVSLRSAVTVLRGVKDRRAEQLARLGIRTVGDLLRHYPARHEDRREVIPLASVAPRASAVVAVTVTGPGETVIRGPQKVTSVPVADASGEAVLTWFGQPYRATQFPVGAKLVCCGTARNISGTLSIQPVDCEPLREQGSVHLGRLVPIHPTTEGLSQQLLRVMVHQALQQVTEAAPDTVPGPLRASRALMTADEAVRAIHFPDTPRAAAEARRRLAYEELLLLQVLLAMRRRLLHDTAEGTAVAADDALQGDIEAGLPFALTEAQRRVLGTVAEDLQSQRPALRLIHGDVGSGKTMIAAFALAAAARAGRQAAFMAPTEILAEQHHRVLTELLRPLGLHPALLTGSAPEREKARARAGLASGDIRVVVGTHALVQEATQFADLAVAVVDEQHRFGVVQRAALAAKGRRPHLFVMTATPIPRTLALVVYGDCDVSVLDQLPPGRRPPVTRLLALKDRETAYQTVRQVAAAGEQSFIVCPLIEESESLQAEAARERHEQLTEGALRGLRVGLLHGRLRPDVRGKVLDDFRRGVVQVLVTTTVVEVGVDVAAATVMVVESAERFGLAQLHQLRGRVGRGERPGTCFLVTSAARSDPAWERLALLEQTADGFRVSEADLRLRGPGDLAGTRQAGLPDLRVADLLADTALIEQAREDAFGLIARDPGLREPQNATLRAAVHALAPTILPLMAVD